MLSTESKVALRVISLTSTVKREKQCRILYPLASGNFCSITRSIIRWMFWQL